VQLVHHDSETSREDHGFVRVKSDDGQLLSEIADYQRSAESWDNAIIILSEVLAKHPSVRQPSAELAAKGWRSIPPGKQQNRRQGTALMTRQYEHYQGNAPMRQTSKQSMQRPSRRPASIVRPSSSVSALANNGQQVIQHRKRSNSTTR